MIKCFEKIFPDDKISKKERVELTLGHKAVDRVAVHEQLSYNPDVISLYTGKQFSGFDYTEDDIGEVIRKTLDMTFPVFPPQGTSKYTDCDGFVIQNDNWTKWIVSRPFTDEKGANDWLKKKIIQLENSIKDFNPGKEHSDYHEKINKMQKIVGETVILEWSMTGFCDVFNRMGLAIYSFFSMDYPETLKEFMELSTKKELMRIADVADVNLSPVILVPEDFATKQGSIFSPEFLKKFHYPYIKDLTGKWHSHDIKVIYHSDGNYKAAIPELINCGVDGFYCLEPNCCMDVVELKKAWPGMVWAGSIDGVDLMERGNPEKVRSEVYRQIVETDALNSGGFFLCTSSEINPPIKPENFEAMILADGEFINNNFK